MWVAITRRGTPWARSSATNGRPAAGVTIELFAISAEGERLIKRAVTNSDGRTDAPLLAGDAYAPGVYELRFHVGAYFRANGVTLPEPPAIDGAPVPYTHLTPPHKKEG